MTQEDKDLLLKYLCMALPYGVKIMFSYNGFRWDWEQTLDEISQCEDGEYAINGWGIHGIKPYLRSMDSMTDDEEEEFASFTDTMFRYGKDNNLCCLPLDAIQWLLKKHFDFMGLIPDRLAIKVTKENNPYENNM